MKKFNKGDEIDAKVVAIAGDSVFIDIGQKSEGVIPLSQFIDDGGKPKIEVGSTVHAFYTGNIDDTENFAIKITATTKEDAKDMLDMAFHNKTPIEAKVTDEIKGGYEVMIGGQRAFCPYSQMGGKNSPHSYVGRAMTFLVTQMEHTERGLNVILSNRAILDAQESQKVAKSLEFAKVGQVVDAQVKSTHPFGAILCITAPAEIAGLEGLLPISEISYDRVSRTEDALQSGESTKAKILELDTHPKGKKKYSLTLSIRAMQDDPWGNLGDVKVGNKFAGTIENTAPYGLFVNIAKGITGFVHISKLDAGQSTNLRKAFPVGSKLNVVVDKIDIDTKKIELTPSTSKEEDESAQKYMASQDDDETYNPFAALLAKK